MKKLFPMSAILTAVMLFGLVPPSVHASTLLEFSFENFAVGQASGGHSSAVSGISGNHNMANNGVEDFGAPNFKLSMTRFAGAVNFPVLTFTTTVPISVSAIEFLHIHNHNPGYPSYPNYNVDLQIDTGSGFSSLGLFLAAPGGYASESIAGPGWLAPGTYALRWIPQVSPDTNTEFFGLDNIRLVGDTDTDGDGVLDADDLCPDTGIPETVPTVRLGVNRFALTASGDGFTFDTTAPKGTGPQKSFTVADTAGCSCAQIIGSLGLGQGHEKFGCSISAMEKWIESVNP